MGGVDEYRVTGDLRDGTESPGTEHLEEAPAVALERSHVPQNDLPRDERFDRLELIEVRPVLARDVEITGGLQQIPHVGAADQEQFGDDASRLVDLAGRNHEVPTRGREFGRSLECTRARTDLDEVVVGLIAITQSSKHAVAHVVEFRHELELEAEVDVPLHESRHDRLDHLVHHSTQVEGVRLKVDDRLPGVSIEEADGRLVVPGGRGVDRAPSLLGRSADRNTQDVAVQQLAPSKVDDHTHAVGMSLNDHSAAVDEKLVDDVLKAVREGSVLALVEASARVAPVLTRRIAADEGALEVLVLEVSRE